MQVHIYRLDKGHSKKSLPFDIRSKFCSDSKKTKKSPSPEEWTSTNSTAIRLSWSQCSLRDANVILILSAGQFRLKLQATAVAHCARQSSLITFNGGGCIFPEPYWPAWVANMCPANGSPQNGSGYGGLVWVQLLHPLSTDSACQLLKSEHHNNFARVKKTPHNYTWHLCITLSKPVYNFRVFTSWIKIQYFQKENVTHISANANKQIHFTEKNSPSLIFLRLVFWSL